MGTILNLRWQGNGKETELLRTEMWHIEQEFEFKITQSAAADKDKGEVYKLPQIESLHKGNLSNLKSDGRKMLTIYRKAHEPMRSNWGGKVSWVDEVMGNRCAVPGHTGDGVSEEVRHDWLWKANIDTDKGQGEAEAEEEKEEGGADVAMTKSPDSLLARMSLVWPNWLPKDWPWLATTSTVVLSKANWTGM